MNDAYRSALQALERGERVALASILLAHGSAPRRAGAHMAVFPDGRITETIGGGAGEVEVVRAARECIATKRAGIVRLNLGGAIQGGPQQVCGGRVVVLVEPLDPETDQEWMKALVHLREKGWGALVVRRLSRGDCPECRVVLVAKPGEPGWKPDWRAAEIPIPDPAQFGGHASDPVRFDVADPEEGGAGTYHVLAAIAPTERLVIVGGGHIGKALSEIGALLGFEVAVLDERPEFADPARFPQAARVLCGDPGELLSAMPAGEHAHFVLVSHGYPSDTRALAALAGRGARYIGMIGSRRRVEAVRRALLENGIDPAELDRVHAPIGLDIGSETPEEIAVAIAAEIIAVRSGRDRDVGPLSRREGTA